MKRIAYAGGQFLTDDAIGEALMRYANVLAVVDSADVVTVPAVDEHGGLRQIQLLIGPASQIMAMDTDEPAVEMAVQATLDELAARAETRLPSTTEIGDVGALPAESDAESTQH